MELGGVGSMAGWLAREATPAPGPERACGISTEAVLVLPARAIAMLELVWEAMMESGELQRCLSREQPYMSQTGAFHTMNATSRATRLGDRVGGDRCFPTRTKKWKVGTHLF